MIFINKHVNTKENSRKIQTVYSRPQPSPYGEKNRATIYLRFITVNKSVIFQAQINCQFSVPVIDSDVGDFDDRRKLAKRYNLANTENRRQFEIILTPKTGFYPISTSLYYLFSQAEYLQKIRGTSTAEEVQMFFRSYICTILCYLMHSLLNRFLHKFKLALFLIGQGGRIKLDLKAVILR